jgi:hypothetical protein
MHVATYTARVHEAVNGSPEMPGERGMQTTPSDPSLTAWAKNTSHTYVLPLSCNGSKLCCTPIIILSSEGTERDHYVTEGKYIDNYRY